MPSKPLIGILLVAAVVAAVLAFDKSAMDERPRPAQPGGESEDRPLSSTEATRELGFYPPAPSTAEGMTPEWREFADQVDRICATSYNHALRVEAQIDQVVAMQNWNDRRAEKTRLTVWEYQAATILRATAALGQPPERPDLFSRWRSNVAKRATLRARAAVAAGGGRWSVYREVMNRIYPLKDRGDEIGQRFGLQSCTSN